MYEAAAAAAAAARVVRSFTYGKRGARIEAPRGSYSGHPVNFPGGGASIRGGGSLIRVTMWEKFFLRACGANRVDVCYVPFFDLIFGIFTKNTFQPLQNFHPIFQKFQNLMHF